MVLYVDESDYRILDEYKTLAIDYDIDEGLITRGIKDHEDYDLGFQPTSQSTGQTNQQRRTEQSFQYLWQ